jgi:hypothetical protein
VAAATPDGSRVHLELTELAAKVETAKKLAPTRGHFLLRTLARPAAG